MNLDQIAYNIKNIVEGGMSGEDSNLSIRQIRYMVNYHRANLLTKYTDSGRFVSDVMFETVTINSISSSQQTIAPIIGWANNRAIKSVVIFNGSGTTSQNKRYHAQLMNSSDKDFFQESRFAPNKNQFFATISNDNGLNIRFFTNDNQALIDTSLSAEITAVFAQPVITNPYPIPAELVGSLVETVLAKEFNVYLRTTTDIVNNSVDDKGANPAAIPTSASPNANARSRSGRTR